MRDDARGSDLSGTELGVLMEILEDLGQALRVGKVIRVCPRLGPCGSTTPIRLDSSLMFPKRPTSRDRVRELPVRERRLLRRDLVASARHAAAPGR